jgi:hypothetical protein
MFFSKEIAETQTGKDHQEIAEEVGVDVLRSPAHVVLLEATDSLADGGFDLSLGSHDTPRFGQHSSEHPTLVSGTRTINSPRQFRGQHRIIVINAKKAKVPYCLPCMEAYDYCEGRVVDCLFAAFPLKLSDD